MANQIIISLCRPSVLATASVKARRDVALVPNGSLGRWDNSDYEITQLAGLFDVSGAEGVSSNNR